MTTTIPGDTVRDQEQHLRAIYGRANGRTVSPERCRTCGTWTLTGPDADEMAFHARVDLTPLDRQGEALALILGRRTYELARHGAGCQLTRRTWRRITAWPAGSTDPYGRPMDVLAAHDCTPTRFPTLPTVHVIRQVADLEEDAPCPF